LECHPTAADVASQPHFESASVGTLEAQDKSALRASVTFLPFATLEPGFNPSETNGRTKQTERRGLGYSDTTRIVPIQLRLRIEEVEQDIHCAGCDIGFKGGDEERR